MGRRDALAPQGGFVAAATAVGGDQSPGAVDLIDLTTGTATRAIGDWQRPALGVAFAPDSSAVAAVGGNYQQPGEAKMYSPTSKEVSRIPWSQIRFAATAIAFSPDSRTLAAATHAGKVTLWPIP